MRVSRCSHCASWLAHGPLSVATGIVDHTRRFVDVMEEVVCAAEVLSDCPAARGVVIFGSKGDDKIKSTAGADARPQASISARVSSRLAMCTG